MKAFRILLIFSFFFTAMLGAKSRKGEYFVGIGYTMADGELGNQDVEGQFIRLNANNPSDNNTDFSLYLDYGSAKAAGEDATSWNLGLDYLANFDDFGNRSVEFTPYLGLGVSYMDEEAPIRLGEDGFTWSLLVGAEIRFFRSFSIHTGGRFYGLWSDYAENEFAADAGITWWLNNDHGVNFEYQRAFESELNYFTLRYLYSWQ